MAYHGGGTDPFQYFPGNGILGGLGLNAYPTGVIDRVSGVQSRGTWQSWMNNRNSVPATVQIDIQRSFNKVTKEVSATFTFTALTNLTGQYKYTAMVVEDGIVYPQSGSLGGPNYVHDWTVRAIMNTSYTGDEIVNGTWNQGQQFVKSLTYTLPTPNPPSPDIVPDSCRIAVIVYKVGAPLNSNAEIQQAAQIDMVSPDYVAQIMPESPDVIADNQTPAEFDVMLVNQGLMNDTYDIDLMFDGPSGWSVEYTTPNGTFPLGHIDPVSVNSDDTVMIHVKVSPNGIDGAGKTTVNFYSQNSAGLTGAAVVRNVTNTGIDILVVDAEDDNYEDYIATALDHVWTGTYGVVSRTALTTPTADLSHFGILTWSAGTTRPAFYPAEVTVLSNYLDNGGRLFINGQDIASDIFESNGQSQHAQAFFTNYLHASYLGDASTWFFIKGVNGDPISNGLQFLAGSIYDKSLDKISPAGSDASTIFTYMNGPDAAGIKAATNTYRLVYLAFGFEQIDQTAIRDTVMARSIAWLSEGMTGIGDQPMMAQKFELGNNYPNPFNPETWISYSLENPGAQNTRLVIYNALGQKVKTLVNANQPAGNYKIRWDGTDDSGARVASGVYYYELVSGNYRAVKKMVLMK
ncbi:MAG: hypothetical protein Kow0037_01140 [Calditrichia bacterium]